MLGGGSFSVERRLVALLLLASCAFAAESITGRVFERVEDRLVPLHKVLVSAGSPDGRQTFAVTRSDGEGRYLLTGERAGRLRLSAEKFGYLTVSAGGKRQTELSVNCLETPCGPFDFELVKGGIVAGNVVDDLNEPVENAHIWLLTPGAEETGTGATDAAGSRASGRTDDRGRFRIIGLPAGPYELHGAAGRDGGDTTIRAGPVAIDITAGEEITGISLWLEESAGSAFTVSGHVAGVDLSLRGDHRLFMHSPRRRIQPGPRYGSRYGSQMYRLARDGAFTIEHVPPGDYVFSYSHNQRGGQQTKFQLGLVRVEGEMRGLTLHPLEPTGFRGRLESDGTELPNSLAIRFVRADGSGISARAGASFPDFRFAETQLLPGAYNLSSANHDFYIRAVRVGDKTVEARGLTLEPGEIRDVTLILSQEFAAVSGRVKPPRERRPDEPVAAHYRVGLEGPPGMVSVQTDQNGAFAFGKLRPGSYRICAWSDRTSAEVRNPALWESAGNAARSFPAEPGSIIEIDLTAVE